MFWGILACGVVLYLVIWYYQAPGSPSLDKVPGPARWPIIGSVLEFAGCSTGEMFEKFLQFPKLYGDRCVVKMLNRCVLHVFSPKDIEVVLTHSRNISKNRPYKFMEPWLGNGLLLSTGGKWHTRRKILTPAFHFEILKNFSRVFEEESRSMVRDLKDRIEQGLDVVDVMPFISDHTLYAICETAMGTTLNSEVNKTKSQYKKSILAIGPIIMKRLPRFWLHPDFIFNLSAMGKEFKKCLAQNFSFTDNVIKERRKQRDEQKQANQTEGKRKLALLDLLLEAESKGEIDMEGIRAEVNTFMFEGHDTTAAALTFGLMLLADHPEVQERVFEECKCIFGASDRNATTYDIAEMRYLEAVIKEILRLYPSVPMIGRMITEDFMLDDDLHVTPGTEVAVHIYAMHRREDLFPEPEEFRPERFLDGDKMHFSYIPFSAGSRNCIGQRFAMLEMKYMLSDIVRHFKMSPIVKGFRPKVRADLVLRPNEPIYVRFALR